MENNDASLPMPPDKLDDERTVTDASAIPTPEITAAEALAAQQAYDKFLAVAQELARDQLIDFRADAALAYHNTRRGLSNVLVRKDEIVRDLPRVDLAELMQIGDFALATHFAALQAHRDERTEGQIQSLFASGYPLRRKLMRQALSLAEDGFLPIATVRDIRKGTGKLDAANDLVRLAALFASHQDQLAGKTTVTAEDITQAGQLGTALGKLLVPTGGVKDNGPSPEQSALTEIRNRFWTLLVRRHEVLWKVGAWLWGKDVDEHVPPLQSRVLGKRKSKDEGAGTGKVVEDKTKSAT